jgi:putative permease
MVHMIRTWLQRHFSHPEAIILFLSLCFGVIAVVTMGHLLAPVIASIVIAYVLQSMIIRLEKYHCPHQLAVAVVYLVFLAMVILALVGLLPLLSREFSNLFHEMPNILTKAQAFLLQLSQRYPDYFSIDDIQSLVGNFRAEIAKAGQLAISVGLAGIHNVLAIVIYAILVPILIFFFLMDRSQIVNWFTGYMPKQRRLVMQVLAEVNQQIGNYIKGRIIEIIVVGVFTYAMFVIMGLPYAALLAALVGVSCIIPYIGAVVVTVPVAIIGFWQWGWSAHFAYLMLGYAIIIALDANVLVPLLFSEALDLHPIAIIVSILFFGGLWGFWGVFFAIPLASLIKAVINAWPREGMDE